MSGDEVEQCRLALRQGVQLVVLAARLRISPDELARLLGLHQQPRHAAVDDCAELDLWGGCDRLQEVL